MMRAFMAAAAAVAGLWIAAAPADAMQPKPGAELATACASLPLTGACGMIAEAAKMLEPSYRTLKPTEGVAGFNALGYDATYIPAKAGSLQGTTDVFLVSRRGTKRLFIVITGTESLRDWAENAKFRSYTATYKDGQFYVPPGHAGFRRGMLNIVNDDVLRIDEFDGPVTCDGKEADQSRLTRHLCLYGLGLAPGSVKAIIVGHSRGAGIGLVTATAFAGLEIVRPTQNGPASVKRQAYWPLELEALIAFSPPYAVYRATDAERRLRVPAGFPDQWAVLAEHSIPQKTVSFLNEQDIVPLLSLGLGRHFGHRFRIGRTGSVVYEGFGSGAGPANGGWGTDSDIKRAHSSHFYCADVLRALGQQGDCPEAPDPMN